MRRTLLLIAGLSLLAITAVAADFTGWISDSTCGISNANKDGRDCTERCIKDGAKPVLVTDNDQKVYQLSDPEKVKGHLKNKVKITGEVKGDTIVIAKVVDVK